MAQFLLIKRKPSHSPLLFLASTHFLWCYVHLLNVLLDPKVGEFSLPQAERGGGAGGGVGTSCRNYSRGPHWESYDLHCTGFFPLSLGVVLGVFIFFCHNLLPSLWFPAQVWKLHKSLPQPQLTPGAIACCAVMSSAGQTWPWLSSTELQQKLVRQWLLGHRPIAYCTTGGNLRKIICCFLHTQPFLG